MIFARDLDAGAGLDHGLIVGHRIAPQLLRLKRFDRGFELDHRHRRVPHALEMGVELRRSAGVANDDEVIQAIGPGE